MRHSMALRRFGRGRTLCVVGLATTSLILGGCTSGGGKQGSISDEAAAEPPAASIQVTPGESETINPVKPVLVRATHGTLTTVTMTNPKKGTKVKGKLSSDGLTWTSAEPLAYNTAYQLTVDAKGEQGGRDTEKKTTVTTLKPVNLAYPSLIPPPSISDVGVGQPLVVRFDQDIKNKAAAEKAMKVKTTPAQTGGWYWISDKEAHYRPKVYWQPGTDIKLHVGVYGKDLGGGMYGESDRDAAFTVHDSWIAKADGSDQQMQIFHNGQMVKTMPISMGKDVTPTHAGWLVLSEKVGIYTMDSCTYGVCGGPHAYRTDEYYAMRISNDGEFVHENPDSVSSQGNTNVSHGCINLNESNAIWFFDHFNLGDVVEESNSNGPELPIYDTYGDWAVSWSQWQQGSALR